MRFFIARVRIASARTVIDGRYLAAPARLCTPNPEAAGGIRLPLAVACVESGSNGVLE